MKKLIKIRLINWHYFVNEEIQINGNVLLTGQNATGKSTILDAITYVVTAGDTQFNVAANENGKRDLKSYIKCKVSRADKEYLRDGDRTGHIALEFYDDIRNQTFTVGTVIDAFGDAITATQSVFYLTYEPIRESLFVDDEGILSISGFKAKNPGVEVFKTKKEAKRVFRTIFGNLNDDFFRIIHKALAFKAISDVKEFIYDHLLEQKNIDVSNIREAILAYKELETTLNAIKLKIDDLREISSLYQEINTNLDEKDYYSYLLSLFEEKSIALEIEKLENEKREALERDDVNQRDLASIKENIEQLDYRSKELYRLLSDDKDFMANEYLDKQILKTSQELEQLESLEKDYINSCQALKEKVREMRKVDDNEYLKRLANASLVNVSKNELEQTKLQLLDIAHHLEDEYDNVMRFRNSYDSQKQEVLKEIQDISNHLKLLENRNLRYNPRVNALKMELEAGLKNVYGQDIPVHVLAELLEIEDEAWADTIEVYLNQRRFNLIVEPRYYDQALQIYNRVKNTHNIYGVGLVNTKKIGVYKQCNPKSMASIIKSENEDARHYINYLVGNLILCDDVTELENYQAAITNEGMVYQGYVVSALNYNAVERPFIGHDASDKQLQKYNQLAIEKKNEYLEISQKLEEFNMIIHNYNSIDLKNIINQLGLSSHIDDLRQERENLISRKEKGTNISDLEAEYNDVLAKIRELKALEANYLVGGGQVKEHVRAVDEEIATCKRRKAALAESLKELKLAHLAIEERATRELNDCIRVNKDVHVHEANYARLVSEAEGHIGLLTNSLTGLQLDYNRKYNTLFGVGLSEMPVFLKELDKLEKSEIISYEQKVRSARNDAELIFREDFLSKLRDYIKSAEDEIRKVNDTLRQIRFGEDSYEFVFLRSNEFSAFYDMVTSDLAESNTGIFAIDFEMKYQEQLELLFANLSVDQENANGALNKFTDYRTYLDYDIKITNFANNQVHESYYSHVFKEKSGGETQVPFYVAIIASFVRIYAKNNKENSDAIGLALFDEAFNNLDASRMKAMMNFINSMPLQIILACPSDRMKTLAPYTNTTIVAFRKGIQAATQVFDSKDVK